ncbi:hypothetical protein TraAM80_08685, partial [Trypanosoma rangeli]
EQQRLCEGLQQQLQERPPPALVAPMVAGVDPASLFSLVDSLRASLGELEHRLGYSGDTGSRHTAPAAGGGAPRVARRAKAPPTPEAGATRGGGGGGSPRSHQPQPLSQGPDGAVRLVLPAPGAGALRAATVISGAPSTTTERRKRARRSTEGTVKPKRHASGMVAAAAAAQAASLFKNFTPATEKEKGSVVNFGNEPIADYLGLLEKTDASNVDVLRRELRKFCGGNVDVLASCAVEHFLSKSVLTAGVVTLWKHTERVMHIGQDVYPVFMQQAVRKLVHLLSPDCAAEIDHTPQLRCLALVVRAACAIQLRDTVQGAEVSLFVAFYECTVSALRSWRLGGSPHAQHHVLGPWMVVVQHLCGFVVDFHEVVRYYANSERVLGALSLPASLTRYTAQAVMAACYFTSSPQSPAVTPGADVTADTQAWLHFCDAMDWSHSELPLDLIGSAAARILARCEDALGRGEALLSLRLLVLQNGLGFLQGLTEELRASRGAVDIDAAFAELFSLAVIDLQLEDPRDEQWGRAMAFFADYLSAISVAQAKSTAELLAACKETHLLVLRAMLQLCHGTVNITEAGAEHLTNALQWAKTLHVGLTRSARESKAAVAQMHPFQSTQLGKQLRHLCSQEL